MPASKAHQKASNKWIAKAYDRVNLTLPKGQKDVVQSHASARGESVNGFIGRAINEVMERDSKGVSDSTTPGAVPERPQQATGAPGGMEAVQQAGAAPTEAAESAAGVPAPVDTLPLPPEVMQVAQTAAEATGETVPEFVCRAVETTATTDRRAFQFRINPAESWQKEREKMQQKEETIRRLNTIHKEGTP